MKKMPKSNSKVIHVADDFGISKLANRNILKLIRAGKIDRVSVLVDHNDANLNQREVRQLLSSKVKIDLHLDYQVFLFKRKKRKLKEGAVGRVFSFAMGYLLGKGNVKKVQQEWEDQIVKFKKTFGKSPDGINSHQYIHLFPSYFKVTVKLAKKYGIPYIRYGKSGIIKSPSAVYRILYNLRKVTLSDYKANCCSSSDFLVSLDWIKNPSEFFRTLPEGSTEIVCHPEREEELKLMFKYF